MEYQVRTRRIVGRGGVELCGAPGLGRAGVGYRRLDSPAGGLVRDCWFEADVWTRVALWAGGVCVVAGSDWSDDADRGRCRVVFAGDCGPRRARFDELARGG